MVGGGGVVERPLEATGGHRGQFPHTDFGLTAGMQCFSAARTLKSTLKSKLLFVSVVCGHR